MFGLPHFSGRWLFAAFLCIGMSLLNAPAWSAEPDWEEAWKPPKLPEAVTVKPEGEVLKVAPIDRDQTLSKQQHRLIQSSRPIGKKMAPKRLLGPMTMNLYEGRI